MTSLALDTSVAIPFLVASHRAHAEVSAWIGDRAVALAGHALAETYSVLTRLPGDARVAPADAARLLGSAPFVAPLTLSVDEQARLPERLAASEVAGGAVYDALVGLAAMEHGAVLATRDARALGTYERIGASVEVVAARDA